MENELDPRFADTIFVVEANSFELHMLWSMHSHDGSIENTCVPYRRYEWEPDCFGSTVKVGEIGGKDILITFFWNTIDGHRVAFYERCSWCIDFYQVETCLLENCNPKWDGNRRAHCNAMNFHHCLDAIDELNKK